MARLYLVPTPIGNLEDMTLRAIRVLKEVSLILAEDTRKTGLLLKHFNISNAMQSHHMHNEHKMAETIAHRISAGESVALVTDAGTPGISDPGFYWYEPVWSRVLKWNVCPEPQPLCRPWLIQACPVTGFILKVFCHIKKVGKHD